MGHVALQFLKKLGYEVSAFTTSPNKEKSTKELGADQVIISTDEKQMDAAAGKFDFIINTIPSVNQFEKYLNCVCRAGYFVQVGAAEIAKANVQFNYFPLIVNEIKYVGSLLVQKLLLRKCCLFV